MKHLITSLILLLAMLSGIYYLIQTHPTMNHARFSYSTEKVMSNTFLVVILDRYDSANPSVTVTNDMEHVLATIFADECDLTAPFTYGEINPSNTLVIYRDSEGEWAQVGFQFSQKKASRISFHFINAQTQTEARQATLDKISPQRTVQ